MSTTNKGVAEIDGAAQAAAGNDRYEPINHWAEQMVSSWNEAGKMGEANKAGRESFEAEKERLNK